MGDAAWLHVVVGADGMIVGCDPSTVRCALADETGRVGSILLYSKEENGRRLALSYEQIRLFALQFCGPNGPSYIVVEQPSGRHRNNPLVEMCGVTRAALFKAWEAPVFLMPPRQWKKAVLGNGNAGKDQYVAWCRDQGYTFSNDDEAAALCIAQAALKLGSVS